MLKTVKYNVSAEDCSIKMLYQVNHFLIFGDDLLKNEKVNIPFKPLYNVSNSPISPI
jgi:hypothetical protein